MKVYQVVASTLAECGVERLFGLMGDANLRHAVSFIDEQGGTFVSALDEGGAVSMADGYSRVTGRVGVASVTHGPGMTNTLTSLTEAVRADSRVVLLTGDTASRPDHLQRLDLRAAATLAGAEYVRVLDPERTAHDLRAALDRVVETERPIVVDVPVDLEQADVSTPVPPTVRPRGVAGASPADLDRALGIIASARRPVVLAGRGALHARAELVELAGLLGAPLATTLLAKGLFAGEACDVGIAGNLGTAEGIETIWSSDCVVVFGAGLNRYTTVDGSLLDGRAVVQVDRRAERIGRLAPVEAPVVGDTRVVAESMVEQLREFGLEAKPWFDQSAAVAVAARDRLAEVEVPEGSGTVDPRAAMAVLDAELPADRLVVTDTGRFVYAPWRLLDVAHPSDFVHTLNFASIGLGLGTAIGASVGHPDRLTVAVVGDGGGMMAMGQLVTAVEHGLPLLVVVCNDGAYGMEYRALERAGVDPRHSLLRWPDFVGVARGYGADGATVRSLAELRLVLGEWSRRPRGPFVIDVRTDPAVDITP